ncbi:MAG TPA: hypothetical protein VGH62_02690 [Bradyrhizobium sp.]
MKQITSDALSLRHGRGERIGGKRIGSGTVCEPGFRQGQAMGQQLQPWRLGDGEKLWLSMLIDAMEEISRPELRAVPCDRSVLAAVSAQLARPASPYPHCGSYFSLRN